MREFDCTRHLVAWKDLSSPYKCSFCLLHWVKINLFRIGAPMAAMMRWSAAKQTGSTLMTTAMPNHAASEATSNAPRNSWRARSPSTGPTTIARRGVLPQTSHETRKLNHQTQLSMNKDRHCIFFSLIPDQTYPYRCPYGRNDEMECCEANRQYTDDDGTSQACCIGSYVKCAKELLKGTKSVHWPNGFPEDDWTIAINQWQMNME